MRKNLKIQQEPEESAKRDPSYRPFGKPIEEEIDGWVWGDYRRHDDPSYRHILTFAIGFAVGAGAMAIAWGMSA